MPRYKNLKPSILGLSTKAQTTDDKGNPVPGSTITVQPGEVFEAEKADIPEIYFQQRWLEETNEEVTNKGAAPGTNVGPYSDKNPDPPISPPQPVQDGESTRDAVGVAGTPQAKQHPNPDHDDAAKRRK